MQMRVKCPADQAHSLALRPEVRREGNNKVCEYTCNFEAKRYLHIIDRSNQLTIYAQKKSSEVKNNTVLLS